MTWRELEILREFWRSFRFHLHTDSVSWRCRRKERSWAELVTHKRWVKQEQRVISHRIAPICAKISTGIRAKRNFDAPKEKKRCFSKKFYECGNFKQLLRLKLLLLVGSWRFFWWKSPVEALPWSSHNLLLPHQFLVQFGKVFPECRSTAAAGDGQHVLWLSRFQSQNKELWVLFLSHEAITEKKQLQKSSQGHQAVKFRRKTQGVWKGSALNHNFPLTHVRKGTRAGHHLVSPNLPHRQGLLWARKNHQGLLWGGWTQLWLKDEQEPTTQNRK